MPVTIRLHDETATWTGTEWIGGGPLAELGNKIALNPPGPADPAGLANARHLASWTGAEVVDIVAPEEDDEPNRVC